MDRKQWFKMVLTEKLNNRDVVIKGFPGQNPWLEKLLESLGCSAAYATAVKAKVTEGVQYFPEALELTSEKVYFIVLPQDAYNSGENMMLTKAGFKEIEDYLWMRHKPLKLEDVLINPDWGGVRKYG